jgi:hypothetical protein
MRERKLSGTLIRYPPSPLARNVLADLEIERRSARLRTLEIAIRDRDLRSSENRRELDNLFKLRVRESCVPRKAESIEKRFLADFVSSLRCGRSPIRFVTVSLINYNYGKS